MHMVATAAAIDDRPSAVRYPRGEGIGSTDKFLYSATDTRAALNDLRGFDGSPYEGISVEFVQPYSGQPTFSTISYRAQLLRPGEATLPYRHTASTIFGG